MNDLRFGIHVGRVRSRTWRVRSGARRPELFIEREGLEHAMHVSLHQSGRWHLKLNGVPALRWLRPDYLHPGYTRTVVISQPWAVAMMAGAAPPGSILVPLDEGDEETPQFNVFMEQPGANPLSWPGHRSMGTELVGRIRMADGCHCSVVLHRARLDPGTKTISPTTDEERESIKKYLNSPDGMATLFGIEPDGTMSLIDLRSAAGM